MATLSQNILTTILPSDRIDFIVQSKNSTKCLSTSYLPSIHNLQQTGINTSVASFVARSATMYMQRLASVKNVSQTELNLAYALFAFSSPKTVTNNGLSRLVINKSINSRLQAVITETLAIGASLLAGEAVFGVPLQYWNPTPRLQRLDFYADFNGARYGLEAKGRIDFNNTVSAESSIDEKFSDSKVTSQYHHALGVIYTPSININGIPQINPHDIIVIDPESDLPPLGELDDVRSILKHYSRIYKAQGYSDVYEELLKITNKKSDNALFEYFKNGLQELKPGKKWRVKFYIKEIEYVGTAWSDKIGQYGSSDSENESGAYMWGIKRQIHDAIMSGKIDSILSIKNYDDDFWQDQYRYVVIGDGSAIGWAPSLNDLLEMP